ncbi:MAG: DUF4062 domain-containing protein, partial [Pseudomonadota bacterium]
MKNIYVPLTTPADDSEKKRRPVVLQVKAMLELEPEKVQLLLECLPRMQEYFAAAGDKPPLPKCLEKVAGAHVLVVIVAHRYGWVPSDQAGEKFKSITWLECEQAANDGKEVLAFLVDDKHPWPQELREQHAIAQAVAEGYATPEKLAEVQRKVQGLKGFKAWLNDRGVRATFTNPDDLGRKVTAALSDWLRRHGGRSGRKQSMGDPTRYFRDLRERTAHIDIRGLQVGSDKAHSFSIQDLYIPLTRLSAGTDNADRKRQHSKTGELETGGEHTPLQTALVERKLVVVGDPGAGKSTFLRRLAFALVQTWTGEDNEAAERDLGIADRPFPVLVSIEALARHI